MGLDLTKLQKLRHQGSKIIARCPACAENGCDRKGEHLIINDEGRFSCVLFPGQAGQQHRRRIFELVGVKEMTKKGFEVRTPLFPLVPRIAVIKKDILGHLGHLNSSFLYIQNKENNANNCKEFKNAVPNVPKLEMEAL